MLKEGGSADNHEDKVYTNTYLLKTKITSQVVEGSKVLQKCSLCCKTQTIKESEVTTIVLHKSMKLLTTVGLCIFYLYIVINMIIDIEDFGDFIWFLFIGGILLAALRFIIAVVLVAIWGND